MTDPVRDERQGTRWMKPRRHEDACVWFDLTNPTALQRAVDRVAAFRDCQAAHPAGGAT